MPRPTPAQLYERVAQLRKDAAVLDHAHEMQVRPLDAEFRKSDGPWAGAQGSLASARAASATKASEVRELRAEAQKYDDAARAHEPKGSAFDPYGQNTADFMHGEATKLKARADQLDLVARRDVRSAEQQVARLEQAHGARRAPLDKLEEAGDQLESRAAALEEAAVALRAARGAAPVERRKLIDQAEKAIERSDAVTPVDLSHIDPRVLIDATKSLPTLPKSAFLDDAGPLDELAAGPTDPVAAADAVAVAGVPLPSDLADPVDPTGADGGAPGEVDPVTGAPDDRADAGLVDPLGTGAVVASGVDPDLPAPSGADVAELDYVGPVAAVDPLDDPATDFVAAAADELAAPVIDDAYEYET